MAGADRFQLLGEIVAEPVRRHRISGVAAAVIHQLDEGRPAVGDVVGHAPELAKGAVDELHAALRVQNDDAVIEVVDAGAQRGKLRRQVRRVSAPYRRRVRRANGVGIRRGLGLQGIGPGARHHASSLASALRQIVARFGKIVISALLGVCT